MFTSRLVPFSWELVADTDEQKDYLIAYAKPFLHSAMGARFALSGPDGAACLARLWR